MRDAGWRRYLRFWGGDAGADVDDEIAFHLDMRIRDLTARGLSRADAEQRAQREFGDLAAIRTHCVDIDERDRRRRHNSEGLAHMRRDIAFALRSLRNTPGFAATAILCVALGIGVTTAIASAVNAILIRPLPYVRPDELVAVYGKIKAETGVNISYPDFASWRNENRTLAAIGIWTWRTSSLGGRDGAQRFDGADVSASLFPLLGVNPVLGRHFTADEETPGRNRVALISHRLWQRELGGDSTIIGRTASIDATPITIVGVMPAGFHFPDRGDIWTPFATNPAQERHGNRGYAGAIARMRPGVSVDQASADLDRIMVQLERDFPDDNFGWRADVVTLRDDLAGELRRPLIIFVGAVGFVLLIVCANVANLMLARGATREREIAIRSALGGDRGRILRQLLTESFVIAFAGAAVGILVAWWGVKLLGLAFPDGAPFYVSIAIDRVALAFMAVLAAVTAVVFGTLPAFKATRVDIGAALREGTRGTSGGESRSRLRNALVVAEVALSVVLMVGAALFVRSYHALESTSVGFDRNEILSARLSLPPTKYARARRVEFYERLYERVAAIPGVSSVGSAQGIPFSGWNVQAETSIEGRPPSKRGEDFVSLYQYVSPSYLTTIGVPLLRGRHLARTDRDSAAPVVVINELFARQQFPNEDPIGKRVKTGSPGGSDPWATIVGVVGTFQHVRLPEKMMAAMYYPYASWPVSSQTIVLRVETGDPHSAVGALRAILREMDPDVALYRVQTIEEAVSRSFWRQRLQREVLGSFAIVALVLASIGLYGVISYTVAQRTRELGVRIALGATRRNVSALVLWQSGRLVIVGLAIGLAGAYLLSTVLAKSLYEVAPRDPLAFAVVPGILAVVALVASWVPARRAARVDPLVAMRGE